MNDFEAAIHYNNANGNAVADLNILSGLGTGANWVYDTFGLGYFDPLASDSGLNQTVIANGGTTIGQSLWQTGAGLYNNDMYQAHRGLSSLGGAVVDTGDAFVENIVSGANNVSDAASALGGYVSDIVSGAGLSQAFDNFWSRMADYARERQESDSGDSND